MDKNPFKLLKEHGAYVDSAIDHLEMMLDNPQTFYKENTNGQNGSKILSNVINENKKLMQSIAQSKHNAENIVEETETVLSSTQTAIDVLVIELKDMQCFLEQYGYDLKVKTDIPVEDSDNCASQDLEESMHELHIYKEERVDITPGVCIKQQKTIFQSLSNPNSRNTPGSCKSHKTLDLNESGINILSESPISSNSKCELYQKYVSMKTSFY